MLLGGSPELKLPDSMAKTKTPAVALALFLVVAFATPGFAESVDKRRSDARSKKAAAAAQLDVLRADDNEVEAALRALDTNVAAQSATTQSAQQAEKAAAVAAGSAQARLAATEQRMSDLRAQTTALAIRAYVHPGGDSLLEMVRSRDLGEASRRETLLGYVASTDRDVVDRLRATRQDQQSERTNLARLREEAESRRKASADRLAELEQARGEQARIKAALDGRIQAYTAEVDGFAREEASLQATLRARAQPSATPSVAVGSRSTGSAAPRSISGSGLIWPVSGPINSPFGPRWGRMHTGIDIGAATGTPIRAAKAGTVILAGSNGGYGNAVVIDHGGGFSTLYAHNSSVSASQGASVSQGQVIASSGCSGSCTGPHLHFETRVNGSAQNPLNYLS